jgi:hypothetical protein
MTALPLLRADCGSCFGLCCVATTLTRSSDFAFDKPAGEPCRHLGDDFGCEIHAELRPRGMPGCTTYDCFGAGQRVAQETYGGRDWRSHPATAAEMFAVFGVVRDLHELLWLLTEARGRVASGPLRGALDAAHDATADLATGDPASLLALDVGPLRGEVAGLLRRTSGVVRARVDPAGPDHAGQDLAGARFEGADLRGADLRGALLIGADLRGADLRLADLLGTDLRGARLDDADLGTALFLSQFQANAATGGPGTVLPPGLDRPGHWGVDARG